MTPLEADPASASTTAARLGHLLAQAVVLDLETGSDGAIHKVGALHAGREFRRQGRFDLERALDDLCRFAAGARFVIGHNLLGHDLPTLRAKAPALALLRLPVIDTLYLSPLAFPENPYHRLVKSYKLVRDRISDPVADCHLAAQVLCEQAEEFTRRAALGERDLLAVYQFCFRGALALDGNPTGGDGIAAVLALAAGGPPSDRADVLTGTRSGALPSIAEVRDTLLGRWPGRACVTVAPRLILGHLADPALRPVIAYAAAWLQEAGGSSVLPPWVRHRFPRTQVLLKALRDVPCGDPACAWCRDTHDPVRQLHAWFGFDQFRPEPTAPDGGSLQQAIVQAGIADQAMLALMPTGRGKSLCFQLPGLVRHRRRGSLAVVISRLQALMKDQVDQRCIASASATTSSRR